MNGIANYNIYFGAVGWEHLEWRRSFYPDDLPEDWQLSYYNTQFRCVYLPRDLWIESPLSVAQSWRENTQTNFRFVLEKPDSPDEGSRQFLKTMGERAIADGGSPNQPYIYWFPQDPDLRLLSREIQYAVDEGRDLYLLNREAHLPSLEKIRSLVELMGY